MCLFCLLVLSCLLSTSCFCSVNLAIITNSKGEKAWWLLTFPRIYQIHEIRVYSRYGILSAAQLIDGVTVWTGISLTGGSFEGAVKVGTIQYDEGRLMYIFSDLELEGSSVQLRAAGTNHLQLSEVEVYIYSREKG